MPHRLDRPGGDPPRGSRWGTVALLLLGVIVPMMGGLVVGVRRPGAITLASWLLLPFFGWVFLLVAAMTGMVKRWFWGVCLSWTLGVLVAASYLAALTAAIDVPFGLVAANADRRFLGWYAFGWLLAASPLWFLLVRLLRLRFWQPWRRPDEWERGDEPPPAWALSVLNVTRPGMAAEVRRASRLPPRPRARWQRWLGGLLLLLAIARVALALLG